MTLRHLIKSRGATSVTTYCDLRGSELSRIDNRYSGGGLAFEAVAADNAFYAPTCKTCVARSRRYRLPIHQDYRSRV